MSAAKVDVLAALDEAAFELNLYAVSLEDGYPRSEGDAIDARDGLVDARHAVSDLIAAAQRVTAAFRANGREPGFCPRTHQECEAAITSLDRVNARIGGAA